MALLRGGCGCGAVRYETAALPFHETVCHCVDCRRAVGATAVAWFTVKVSALAVTGRPLHHRSSARATRSFCGACGTSLFYTADAAPGEIDVTIASLDDPGACPPKDHVEAAGRPRWAVIEDGLPVHPGRRDAG